MIVDRARGAWGRFWFEPTSTAPVAVFRIAVGLVAFLWSLALLPNLHAFFSSESIEPVPVDVTWGLLGHFRSDTVMYVAYAVLLISALCVLVGLWTRLASIVLFVLVFSFIERTLPIFNSGDGMLRILTFFLIFMPAGESLSVDRWRRHHDHFWDFPARAPWALRLVQVQVSVLYLSSVHHKIVGGTWTDGTALSYVWRMDDILRFQVPGFVARSIAIGALLSYLTLAIEAMIGVLVWVPSTRALVLWLGVGLHIGIDLTLRIGFFSTSILVAYLAFLAPDTAERLILRVRHVLATRTLRAPPHPEVVEP